MADNLKPSSYNFLFDLDDGTHVAYNAISGAFARIQPEYYLRFQALLADPASFDQSDESSKEFLAAAKRAQFIVDGELDELEFIRFRSNVARFTSEVFHITILPTLECNFRCPYCYENPEKGRMSPEMQRRLSLWVSSKLPTARVMSAAWFGGEPLLALDVIRRLSANFQEACTQHKTHYRANMTTNGYYLIPKVIRELESLGIDSIQITLDGPPESHNGRRMLANGKGSYDRVVANMVKLCELADSVLLTLRVNCDAASFITIDQLLPILPDIIRQKCRIYFRQVFPPPQWWDALEPTKQTTAQWNNELDFLNLQKKAQDMGYHILLTGYAPQGGYCEADYLNHFVVDHKCNLHKCTVAFDEEHRIGFIDEAGNAKINAALMAKWLARDTFNRVSCRACKILPLCMGGCGFSTLCAKNKAICSTINNESMMHDNLRLLFRNLRGAENVTAAATNPPVGESRGA